MNNEDYKVVNIRDYLIDDEKIGEDSLRKKLSDFTCPMNKNVEEFLKEKLKSITVKEGILSKTIQKKISRISEYDSEYHTFRLSAYLIAQFGKNFTDNANEKITGHQLMELAIQKIKELQYLLGGTVVFLEAICNKKIIEFYTKHKFKEFDTRQANTIRDGELVQLLGTL